MADTISFLLNDTPVQLANVRPNMTVLDWLRGPAVQMGTKEGCAEGDCGACTILVETRSGDGSIERRAATSCILLVGQLDGLGIRTIDHKAAPAAARHLQQAFADGGGTQCGFCTPGFVMSAQALLERTDNPSETEIHDAIAGNLCRCTGYRPIVDAIRKAAEALRSDGRLGDPAPECDTVERVTLPTRSKTFDVDGAGFLVPPSLREALRLRDSYPDAQLYAGGTDLGLLAGRDRRPPKQIISLARVVELTKLIEQDGGLRIGAAVPYADVVPAIVKIWQELGTYLSRLGSAQIRSMGTIGGNLGTASPIGDMLPVLLALDAEIAVASSSGSRTIPMVEFVTGYRQSALAADEIITEIRLPARAPDTLLFAEKLSRRRDQDISALTAVFRLRMDSGTVTDARIAFGGMADRPIRTPAGENALLGKPWSIASVRLAASLATEELMPRSDIRAPAHYRRRAAENLFLRLFLRVSSPGQPLELDDLRHG